MVRAMLSQEWLLDETYTVGGFGFRLRSDLPQAQVLARLLGRMEPAEGGSEDVVYSLTRDADDPRLSSSRPAVLRRQRHPWRRRRISIYDR